MKANSLTQLFLEEVKRRLFLESWPRLHKCLDLLTEEEVWARPNPSSNSVGNLVLHLCGNARQWIVSGLGGAPDHRRRDLEFSETGPIPKARLAELLDQLKPEIWHTLDRLSEEDLLKTYAIQGFQESGISVLVHVVEHFSYHTGQVSYFVKAKKDLDLQYYTGHDLNQTSS